MRRDPLIEAEDALARHGDGRTRFLDASWTFSAGPAPRAEGVIDGAMHFDIDIVKDASNPLPHMLPAPQTFARHAGALGLTSDTPIIVYDRMGVFAAPRVWWMFHAMGHENIMVLNGGLPAWIGAGGAVVREHAAAPTQTVYKPEFKPQRVISRDALAACLGDGVTQILDARSPGRFSGQEAEPRPFMRSGHMPGALNLHYASLIEHGRLVSSSANFGAIGLDLDKPVVTSCGSGVTACILALALFREGKDAAVYDGSWVEWGSHSDTLIETG